MGSFFADTGGDKFRGKEHEKYPDARGEASVIGELFEVFLLFHIALIF